MINPSKKKCKLSLFTAIFLNGTQKKFSKIVTQLFFNTKTKQNKNIHHKSTINVSYYKGLFTPT